MKLANTMRRWLMAPAGLVACATAGGDADMEVSVMLWGRGGARRPAPAGMAGRNAVATWTRAADRHPPVDAGGGQVAAARCRHGRFAGRVRRERARGVM